MQRRPPLGSLPAETPWVALPSAPKHPLIVLGVRVYSRQDGGEGGKVQRDPSRGGSRGEDTRRERAHSREGSAESYKEGERGRCHTPVDATREIASEHHVLVAGAGTHSKRTPRIECRCCHT